MYQMDMERVRYALSRYVRTRILKIERNLDHILSSLDIMDRLSLREKMFASKLHALNNAYFEDNVSARMQLQNSKESYDLSNNRQRHAQPPLHEFVFCRALEGVEVVIDQDNSKALTPGDVSILQYASVRDHVVNGRVELL